MPQRNTAGFGIGGGAGVGGPHLFGRIRLKVKRVKAYYHATNVRTTADIHIRVAIYRVLVSRSPRKPEALRDNKPEAYST